MYEKTVTLPDAKIDKYGRTVSRVLVGNTDAGLEMIKAGMAWHYKKYEIEQLPTDRASYGAAEIKARNALVGLWSQVTPTRPEDIRYESKAPKAAGSGAECPCGTNNFCTGSLVVNTVSMAASRRNMHLNKTDLLTSKA